jgi:hypothetical protein
MVPFSLPAMVGIRDFNVNQVVKNMAERTISYVMQQGSKNYSLYRGFLINFLVFIRIIFDKFFDELTGKVRCSNAMFEPCMSRTWKNIFKTSKLLDLPQSLKMRSIDEVPNELREVDQTVDRVVDLPLIRRILSLLLLLDIFAFFYTLHWICTHI